MDNYKSFLSRHDVVFDTPAVAYNQEPGPNLVDGPLLGNGDIGAVIHGPPERMVISVGKNDVWDRREHPQNEPPVTQAEYEDFVLNDTDGSGLQALEQRSEKLREAYAQVYPCPKPVGQITIGAEELSGAEVDQRLSLFQASVQSHFAADLANLSATTFVPYHRNLIITRINAQRISNFHISLRRQIDSVDPTMTPPEFGAGGSLFWVRHRFPPDPLFPSGFEYVMMGRIIGAQYEVSTGEHEAITDINVADGQEIQLYVAVVTSRDAVNPHTRAIELISDSVNSGCDAIQTEHEEEWQRYWERSSIHLDDGFVERIWYLNRYFLACCSKKGCVPPGLYGNWITNDASYWHGDYHYNYNFQQPFWGAYTCNTTDLAWPYYEFTSEILPMAKKEAESVYGIRGAKYPLSAYPTVMDHNPYPVIPWDRNMCLSAWAAQNYWWHYLHTQDEDFLRDWAYPVISESARFYQEFMKFEDERYMIWPTVSPEHHGTTEGFRLNRNCTIDLALIKFIVNAAIEASEKLGVDEGERSTWITMVNALAPYPTFETHNGTIFVDVDNAKPIEYNLPVPVAAVVPGDDIGLHSDRELYETAVRTAETLRINGNDGFIILPMAWMRLGMKHKYDEFKKMCRDRIWRNGVTTTSNDHSEIYGKALFPFAGPVVENFALTAVINEMLMQSYNGTIRFFPALPKHIDAGFEDLLAVGGFLVTAEIADGELVHASITSNAGLPCHLYNPWPNRGISVTDMNSDETVAVKYHENVAIFETIRGRTYQITKTER